MPRRLVIFVAATVLLAACSDDDDHHHKATATVAIAPTQTATRTVAAATSTPIAATATATGTAVAATATVPPTSTRTAAPPTSTATEHPPTPSLTATATATQTGTATASPTVTPPRAIARRITDPADLITGPLADGRIGDYLLANDVARFIIQDAPQRDLYSVGTYGGNLIDAELIGHPGLDNFLEIQPAVQIETVINAQTVVIVNDGSDGAPAVVRSCGPDDVLDFVNPSTIIEDIGNLPFPAEADDHDYDVQGCTEYSLELGKPYVKMVTTILNNSDTEIGLFIGDYINAAGQVEQWTSSGKGLGEILTDDLGVMSYIGYGEAYGVDYAHITVPIPGSPHPGSSFFTAAGVSYVMASNSVLSVVLGAAPPTFLVPAHGSNSFTRYFAVGDGSGSNAVTLENELKGIVTGTAAGCVTAAGQPLPDARVVVGPVQNGAITGVTSVFVTGPDGCYRGTLRPGTYGLAAAKHAYLYEGGAETPLVHPLTVAAGETVTQDIVLPSNGTVIVNVLDENAQPVPARIAALGFDPSPEVRVTGGTGLFYDESEALPFGYAFIGYTGPDGTLQFRIEPGTYQLVASRGVEYSYFSKPITVTSGGPQIVDARIARVIDTPGFISSDHHVHGIASADSRVPDVERVIQFAGEGVDNIIMTDHHAHTDLTPTIERLGYTPFVHATVGEEITTWDYGHFNAYPLLIDPTRASGGSTDWALAAPPGRDFKAYGAYTATPHQLQELALTGPQSTPDTVIQINHIDSFFDPLVIDTGVVPPQSFITPENKLRFRLDPNSGNLFDHFKALEVWNGASRGKESEFLDLRLGIWFNHLNQGLITTAIADTDTHEFLPLSAAGARTWTASPTDAPADIDPANVARAVAAGRAVGGQGVYVQTQLRADDDSGRVADLTREGSTTVVSDNRSVTLHIAIQAPIWAPYDRVEIYTNAQTVVSRMRNDVPTLYTAEPNLVLVAGDDFTLERENVFPAIPGAERWVSTFDVPFENLAQDTWFVVIVKGTDGVSHPMFPVMSDLDASTNHSLADLLDGNLGEVGILALGYTNALYADVDGQPGFQPPKQ